MAAGEIYSITSVVKPITLIAVVIVLKDKNRYFTLSTYGVLDTGVAVFTLFSETGSDPKCWTSVLITKQPQP